MITSSSFLSSCCKVTLTLPLAGIATSKEAKPTAETISAFAFDGTLKLKLPLALEVVPILVPLTITDALDTAVPAASVTLPETVRFCADNCPAKNNTPHKRSKIFLMTFCLV